MDKQLLGVYASPPGHWVGDGFPVRSLFSYDRFGQRVSPFLLLDYAGPQRFTPAQQPRGVGEHPHRGFETVTIVYQGEVAHRDSTGQGGLIGPGDVQWMTAAGGILHEEFHSDDFTRRGGELEMAQLWVNLPAKHKLDAPRYQTLLQAAIPTVALEGGGELRVIAGSYAGRAGPAHTFTALNVWDVTLKAGEEWHLELPAGHTASLAVLKGDILVNGAQAAAVSLAVLGTDGSAVRIRSNEPSKLLFLSGEPIAEPIVGYGPFVMNSREQIESAIEDFRSGRFGAIAAAHRETSNPS